MLQAHWIDRGTDGPIEDNPIIPHLDLALVPGMSPDGLRKLRGLMKSDGKIALAFDVGFARPDPTNAPTILERASWLAKDHLTDIEMMGKRVVDAHDLPWYDDYLRTCARLICGDDMEDVNLVDYVFTDSEAWRYNRQPMGCPDGEEGYLWMLERNLAYTSPLVSHPIGRSSWGRNPLSKAVCGSVGIGWWKGESWWTWGTSRLGTGRDRLWAFMGGALNAITDDEIEFFVFDASPHASWSPAQTRSYFMAAAVAYRALEHVAAQCRPDFRLYWTGTRCTDGSTRVELPKLAAGVLRKPVRLATVSPHGVSVEFLDGRVMRIVVGDDLTYQDAPRIERM